MTTARLYLGVDGGGTKTEFVVIDEAGEPKAQATGPTSYHLQVGVGGVESVLRAGVEEVCGQLGVRPQDLAFGFFGLPAYGEDKDADPRLVACCRKILQGAPYACGNDMICGWAAAFGGEDGINMVAGTGSIGYGERRGLTARVGGWGELFSDEGSAYWIAVRGLNAFTRMSDGRLPRGPLHGVFAESLRLKDDVDVCAAVLGPPAMPRDRVAGLAPLVVQAAGLEDGAAIAILHEAAGELAAMAIRLREMLGFPADEPAPVSWSGGVLTRIAPVASAFANALEAHGGFLPGPPRLPPGLGAAIYARREANRPSSA